MSKCEKGSSLPFVASDAKLKLALQRLPIDDRELLLMRCVDRLSIEEIQVVLGISETQAKSKIRIALQKLQRHLN